MKSSAQLSCPNCRATVELAVNKNSSPQPPMGALLAEHSGNTIAKACEDKLRSGFSYFSIEFFPGFNCVVRLRESHKPKSSGATRIPVHDHNSCNLKEFI